MSNKINLTDLDEMFAAAKPYEGDDVPDGKYTARVERVELKNSQQGNPMLAWELRITGGDCDNRMLFRNNMLVTEQNLAWLKTDLGRCGMELAKLSDLESRLDELLDIKLEVRKKTKDEYANVNIIKRVDGTGTGATTSTGANPAAKSTAKPSTGAALSEF